MSTRRHALVVGATGIGGQNLIRRLVDRGWTVTGLSRGRQPAPVGAKNVVADLLDSAGLRGALADVRPTHVFFTSWSRQATEAENCRVNGAMLANLLDAVAASGTVEHVALVTGLKHYLGPFEAYAKVKPDTPFTEEQERLPYENFYYVQEDILWDRAARDGFTWTVHRPHTIIGWAIGNAMNMGVTLAVYGTICREMGRPFVFPGSPEQWEAITDVTDARLLASHLEWAATTPAARNQALNVVNGDVFRWRRLWPTLAEALGVEAAPYPGHPSPLEEQMTDAPSVWPTIVARYGLVDVPVTTLASWWHTDADLGRTIEAFTDMSKSRRLGFMDVQDTTSSFLDLFERLQRERMIPPLG